MTSHISLRRDLHGSRYWQRRKAVTWQDFRRLNSALFCLSLSQNIEGKEKEKYMFNLRLSIEFKRWQHLGPSLLTYLIPRNWLSGSLGGLKEWEFSSVALGQGRNHLELLLKHQFLGPHSQKLWFIFLQWELSVNWEFAPVNKLLVMLMLLTQEPHFK